MKDARQNNPPQKRTPLPSHFPAGYTATRQKTKTSNCERSDGRPRQEARWLRYCVVVDPLKNPSLTPTHSRVVVYCRIKHTESPATKTHGTTCALLPTLPQPRCSWPSPQPRYKKTPPNMMQFVVQDGVFLSHVAGRGQCAGDPPLLAERNNPTALEHHPLARHRMSLSPVSDIYDCCAC